MERREERENNKKNTEGNTPTNTTPAQTTESSTNRNTERDRHWQASPALPKSHRYRPLCVCGWACAGVWYHLTGCVFKAKPPAMSMSLPWTYQVGGHKGHTPARGKPTEGQGPEDKRPRKRPSHHQSQAEPADPGLNGPKTHPDPRQRTDETPERLGPRQGEFPQESTSHMHPGQLHTNRVGEVTGL